jgi:ABC-2 type transport system permease protein
MKSLSRWWVRPVNKTTLIFRHELVNTLKRTGFIVMTLIVPVLALLGIGIFRLVGEIMKPAAVEQETIGYVDQVGGFDGYTVQGNIHFVLYETPELATRAMLDKTVSEYFVIPPNYLTTGIIDRYTLEKQLETPPATAAAIKIFLSSNMLSGKVPENIAVLVQSPAKILVTRLTETGQVATEQGGYGNLLVPGIFSFLLAFSLIFSSSYMLSGLVDEKESRLIEVLLSSISTRQLITGKVLGLGAAGLIQVAVWLVSLPLLLNLASSTFGGFFSGIQLPGNFIIIGIIYFILAYLLFAVISAGIGAISSSSREGQQLATTLTLPVFIPFWFGSLLFIFPNHPFWIFLSIFPITAPVTTILRLGVSSVPVWQLAVSIIVMVLSIIGALYVTTRVLRMYLLMYGKRPALGEIIRNLRNA